MLLAPRHYAAPTHSSVRPEVSSELLSVGHGATLKFPHLEDPVSLYMRWKRLEDKHILVQKVDGEIACVKTSFHYEVFCLLGCNAV
jgi:hypothetical protein